MAGAANPAASIARLPIMPKPPLVQLDYSAAHGHWARKKLAHRCA